MKLPKKFAQEQILAVLKVVQLGGIVIGTMPKIVSFHAVMGRTFYTFVPGHRLVITDKHYFLILGKTFKALIYIFAVSIAMACFLFLYLSESGFGPAFTVFIVSLFIFSFLFTFLIRRVESNCWSRDALKFVDRKSCIFINSY